ncbi:MAG: phytanoyl-CoA dioxygenase family protein [Candidatus Poribacteria bacterium]|nr:phytanoyl-CoA dioxygenase family protein [Candidatus Poribacteria bacterium]
MDPFVESTDLFGNSEALRNRLDQDGYLFFKSLLPTSPVQRAYLDILQTLDSRGLLDPSEPFESGIFKGGEPPARDSLLDLHRDINRIDSFEALASQPNVLSVVGSLIDGEVLVHTRIICRVKYPNDPYDAVSPHQDFWYVKGSHETVTCWMPLMPMDETTGGLAIARGSHRLGVLEHETGEASRFAGAAVNSDLLEWHRSDFEVGDAFLFSSLTIHQGLLNRSRRIRLSVDYRYQEAGTTIEPSHLKRHFET